MPFSWRLDFTLSIHHLSPTSSPSTSAKCVPASLNFSHITLANPQLCTPHASNPGAVHITTSPPTTTTTTTASALFLAPSRLGGAAPLQDDAILLGLAPALGLARAGRRHHALAHAHGHALLRQHRALGAEGLQAQVRRLLPRAAGGKGLWLRWRRPVHDGRGKDGRRGGIVVRGREEVRLGEEAPQLEILREERGRVFREGLGGLGGGGRRRRRGGLRRGVVNDLGGLETEAISDG